MHLHLLPLRPTTRVQLLMISLATFGVKHISINGSIVSREVKTAFETSRAVIEHMWPLPDIQHENVSEDRFGPD